MVVPETLHERVSAPRTAALLMARMSSSEFFDAYPYPHSFKIDAVVVRANQRQGDEHSIVDPLEDQGVHLEASLVKTKR
jgi:hypothetical protein